MSSYIDNPITECTQPLQWEKIVELTDSFFFAAFTSENDGMVPFNHQQWMRKMMMGICLINPTTMGI